MTSKIVLKKSSVSAKAPLSSDLEYGELALNYADGKLFFKDSGDTIKSFGVLNVENTTLTALTDTVANWAYDSTLTGITNPNDIWFKPDGTVMYIAFSNVITQYNLSTAWNITTAVAGTSYSLSTIDSAIGGLFLSPDGTKMVTCGNTAVANATVGSLANEDRAYYFTLGTAWDVTTATLVSSIRFAIGDAGGLPAALTAAQAVCFDSTGTIMYIQDTTTDYVNQFVLSTAYNVSTATYTKRFSVASEETSGYGLAFNTAGTRMYLAGTTGDDVNEYRLSTAWDLSTAVYYNKFYTGWYEGTVLGLYINQAAGVAFVLGSTSDIVVKFRTDAQGVLISPEISTGKIDLAGNTRVNNNFNVMGSAYFESNVTLLGSLTAASITANQISTSTTAITLGGSISTGATTITSTQTTGVINIGGTAGTGAITVGLSTVSQTLNLGTGATTAVSTKAINIGTNGVSGSTTNIAIGSAVAGALGTLSLQSPTVNVGQTATQLQVINTASAVNYVQVTGAATTLAPTISAQGSDSSINLNLNPKGTGKVVTSAIQISTSQVQDTVTVTTTATTANQVLTAQDATIYRAVKFFVRAIDSTAGKYHTTEILAVHNDVTVTSTEYASVNLGGVCAAFDVDYFEGTIRLLATPASANSTTFIVALQLLK